MSRKRAGRAEKEPAAKGPGDAERWQADSPDDVAGDAADAVPGLAEKRRSKKRRRSKGDSSAAAALPAGGATATEVAKGAAPVDLRHKLSRKQ